MMLSLSPQKELFITAAVEQDQGVAGKIHPANPRVDELKFFI